MEPVPNNFCEIDKFDAKSSKYSKCDLKNRFHKIYHYVVLLLAPQLLYLLFFTRTLTVLCNKRVVNCMLHLTKV